MIILSLDYSFAKSGVCIMDIEDDNLDILYTGLVTSDKKLDIIPRILNSIEQIDIICEKYDPNIYIRESPFIGKSSTAKPVLYAHALLELHLYDKKIDIVEVHNATLKAFCRKWLIENSFYTKEELKQFDKKQVVAEFLTCYFDREMTEIYTKRGKLEDDISDSIALGVYHYEKFLK